MNIQDTGKNKAALRIEPAPVQKNPEKTQQTRKEQPERQQRTELTQDEYIPVEATVSESALYNVSDVRRRSIHRGKRFQVNTSAVSDKKLSEKIVDMVLAQGIKKLEIYTEE